MKPFNYVILTLFIGVIIVLVGFILANAQTFLCGMLLSFASFFALIVSNSIKKNINEF